ncbi:hypothetical protein GcC1_176034 [Golovinomyces cichoracearum]|uniref:Uncharacterized protein n=1 Tax=Golovinomyces cichoracearum TaxID=62708 RepID=A0A420HP95_9PEZI|nr:hypothetical protein GcC1_176034 [Golovinomyces cichoracearum]
MASAPSHSEFENLSKAEEVEISKMMAKMEQGEETARLLERKLDKLETKLDDILASFDETPVKDKRDTHGQNAEMVKQANGERISK